jgi:hypothetical protein
VVGALAILPSVLRAQEPGYPITLIPPGQADYAFPAGYQTPWAKVGRGEVGREGGRWACGPGVREQTGTLRPSDEAMHATRHGS